MENTTTTDPSPSLLARYRKALPWLVLGAVAGGFAVGALLGHLGVDKATARHYGLGLPGTLFLRGLKMVVVPLVAAAIITGVAGVGDVRKVGRMGLWVIAYYLGTTAIAVAIGLLLVGGLRPGDGVDPALAASLPEGFVTKAMSFDTFLVGLVSDNPVGDAAADLGQGRLLPLLVFCVLFGSVLTTLQGPGRQTLEAFFAGLYEVMLRITNLVVLFMPVGVFFLVLENTVTTGLGALRSVGLFGLVVMAGLALQSLAVLPLLVRWLGRRSPWALMRDTAPALVAAFSTSSSSATLPLTIDTLQTKAGVPERIVGFIVPLGATANMNGTALYEAVVALFVAQAYGVQLGIADQAAVLIMATLAAVGTAGIPSASLVMIAIILATVGLPIEGIGLVLALDRVLDMCRTTVNVWGDICGAAIYHGLSRKNEETGVN